MINSRCLPKLDPLPGQSGRLPAAQEVMPWAHPRFTKRPSARTIMWFPFARVYLSTCGLISTFSLAFVFNQATSISTSKWPILQTMLSSFIFAKWSPRTMSRHPVVVTKITFGSFFFLKSFHLCRKNDPATASSAASSMVVTSWHQRQCKRTLAPQNPFCPEEHISMKQVVSCELEKRGVLTMCEGSWCQCGEHTGNTSCFSVRKMGKHWIGNNTGEQTGKNPKKELRFLFIFAPEVQTVGPAHPSIAACKALMGSISVMRTLAPKLRRACAQPFPTSP